MRSRHVARLRQDELSMHLIRFRRHDAVQVGVVRDGQISVLPVPTLAELLALPLAELRTSSRPASATTPRWTRSRCSRRSTG